jgi:hypothetical protein
MSKSSIEKIDPELHARLNRLLEGREIEAIVFSGAVDPADKIDRAKLPANRALTARLQNAIEAVLFTEGQGHVIKTDINRCAVYIKAQKPAIFEIAKLVIVSRIVHR